MYSMYCIVWCLRRPNWTNSSPESYQEYLAQTPHERITDEIGSSRLPLPSLLRQKDSVGRPCGRIHGPVALQQRAERLPALRAPHVLARKPLTELIGCVPSVAIKAQHVRAWKDLEVIGLQTQLADHTLP